jgi:ABC-type sugar transport system permease subunit
MIKLKSTLENYLFILPAIVIFTIFYLIPFAWVLQLGLFNWDGIAPTKVFVGLNNFIDIVQNRDWWRAMGNAGWITFIALTFQNALAFLLALACDREIKLKNFYKVVFFIPPVLSEMVVGMVWHAIISDISGANLINRALIAVGLGNLATSWLSNPKTALTTVAIIHSWKGFGWGFLLFLAGLQTIPKELYEAAKIDGANAWGQFKSITMPLMVPVITTVMILTVLGTMQAFVLIVGLVGGELAGHTSVPVLRILASMQASRFGYACAQGVSFGIVLIAISFSLNKISQKVKQF